MKYVNAKDALPEELLSMVQKYYQGGYLYIPKENGGKVNRQTDYKVEYQKMKEKIEQILPLWGIENGHLLQIYSSAWEINHSYVIKVYDDKKQLERNIRIFDICYFLTGLLAEETDDTFTKMEWIENVKSVIAGYESILLLSEKEKEAIPCVMESIEILFAAYSPEPSVSVKKFLSALQKAL